MKRRQKILGIGLCLVFLIGGISYIKYQEEQKSCTKQLFAMDTFMSFTAYGKNCEKAVDAAIDEVERLDALLSTGKETSEVSRINAAGGGEVSEDTAVILQEAMEVYQRTEGLFDVSIYPLMELWGFPSQEYHVPTREELLEVLSLVDASKIAFDGT